MIHYKKYLFSAISVMLLTLSGCKFLDKFSQNSTSTSTPSPLKGDKITSEKMPIFGRFTDFPMPKNSKIDLDKTKILGSQENWAGWITLNTPHSSIAMYDFYKREMPKFGWANIVTMRGNVIKLIYDREKRVSTIHIHDKGSSHSTIEITIAPKG